MRSIDQKWLDLALGYQAVQALEARLVSEFGHAVKVGHQQKFQRDLTTWQKKRRLFFALTGLAILSLIGLCLTAFYFHEVACVIAWWLVTVLLILVALGVAGWGTVREMIAGKPEPKQAGVEANLVEDWWKSGCLPAPTARKRGETDFPSLLQHTLGEQWLGRSDIGKDRMLLLGPSGIWLFETRDWEGRITRQDGVWKQVRKKKESIFPGEAPDENWISRRNLVRETIQAHLPHLAWACDLVQGGIVFTHAKARPEKAAIVGNTAPYGPVHAWLARLRKSAADERFTLDAQLEILDALSNAGGTSKDETVKYESAKELAERLYEKTASELRAYVAGLVKGALDPLRPSR